MNHKGRVFTISIQRPPEDRADLVDNLVRFVLCREGFMQATMRSITRAGMLMAALVEASTKPIF
jgi:hypothetical protein